MILPAFIWGWQKGKMKGSALGIIFRQTIRVGLFALISHAKNHFVIPKLHGHPALKKWL